MVCQFKNGMVCPPATSEAEARWPRFGLVVVATNSRRDYLDQMIRPIMCSSCCNQHHKCSNRDLVPLEVMMLTVPRVKKCLK
jgi:hypothetical protein